jgi:predicted ATPase
MFTKLRIKNFKCLQDTGDLQIRPLTLLVGPNSSGKSSLLQMLLMLRQTVDSTDMDNPLAANNGWVQMGAYPEFIYKGEYNRELEINLELTEFMPLRITREEHGPRKLYVKAVFCYNRKTTQIELKEREISLDNETCERVVRRKGKKYSAVLSYLEREEQKEWRRDDVRPIKFYDFGLTLKRGEKLEDIRKTFPPVNLFRRPAFIIEREFRGLFYLGPLREFPKRFYVTSGQAPQDVGTRGERAVDVLWFSHRSASKRVRKIEEEVRNWFREFGIAADMRLDHVGRGNYYRVVIIDPATGVETNLADIGFGASQTLPIIVESFYAPLGSVILIEQPEIHLHPKAQSILGDLFIKAAGEAQRTFIIETHSEHILARVRRRIAEKRIGKENIAIYYFEPTSDGTRIHEVTLNEQGQYESFPEGFFEEDVVEAFEHLKAMKGSGSE